MLSQLDSKVAGMRSQFMTFSNNGIEFQLSVPDTNDVKSTLGSFVTTIVEQKNTIDDLNKDMSRMAKEHDESISSIMAWATQCITELKNQNEKIESQLKDAVSKLNNFTYNMQGYADKDDVIEELPDVLFPSAPTSGPSSAYPSAHASRASSAVPRHEEHVEAHRVPSPVHEPHIAHAPSPTHTPAPDHAATPAPEHVPEHAQSSEPSKAPTPAPTVEHRQSHPPPHANTEAEQDEKPVIFFPTENPVPIGHSAADQHHVTRKKSVSPRSSQSHSRKASIAEDTVGDLVHIPNKDKADKKSRKRANSLLYLSTPEVRVPKTARGRWLWAFNMVKKMLRIRVNKISLTRARVVKGQSVMDRLERLEKDLFNVTAELERVNAARKEELALLDKLLNPPAPEPEAESKEAEVVLRAVDVSKVQSRVHFLADKTAQIRESLESLSAVCPYLVEQSARFQDPKTHTEGDHLQSYLKLDAEIRSARAELKLCESNAFVVEELISTVEAEVREVCAHRAEYDEPSNEAVGVLDTTTEDLVTAMDNLKFDASRLTDLMFLNSNVFADNWKQFVSFLESAPSNAALKHSIDLLNVSVRETKERVFDMDERLVKIEDSDIMNPPPPAPAPVVDPKQLEREREEEARRNRVLPEDWSEQLQPLVKDMIDAYLEANAALLAAASNGSNGGSRRRSLSRSSVGGEEGTPMGGDRDRAFHDGEDEEGRGNGDDGDKADGEGNGDVGGDEEQGDRSHDQDREHGSGSLSPEAAAEAAARKAKAEEARLKMLAKKREAALLAQQQAEEKAKAEAEAKAAAVAAKKAQQQQQLAQLQQQQQQALQQAQLQQQQQRQQSTSTSPPLLQAADDAAVGADMDEEVAEPIAIPNANANASNTNSSANTNSSNNKPNSKAKSRKKIGLIAAPRARVDSPVDELDQAGVDVGAVGGAVAGAEDEVGDSEEATEQPVAIRKPSAAQGGGKPKRREQQSIREMLARERSTVGSGSGSGPNSGSGAVSGAADPNISNEIALLVRKMEEIYQDKLDTEKGMEMLASKANAYDLDNKVDVEMFDAVEKSLQSITQEIGDIRKVQKQELDKLKAGLQKSLLKALGNIMVDRQPTIEPGVAAISTRALCLNCGRDAIARPTPSIQYQAAAFPNALVTHSTAGPDVMRGGFKLPVTKVFNAALASASSASASLLEDQAHDYDQEQMGMGMGMGSGLDGEAAALSAELAPLSPIQPSRGNMKTAGMMSQSLPSGGMTALKVVKAIRHAQGREEGTQLRPIYRKGFPARKTLKADVPYGPEIRLDSAASGLFSR